MKILSVFLYLISFLPTHENQFVFNVDSKSNVFHNEELISLNVANNLVDSYMVNNSPSCETIILSSKDAMCG